MAAVAGSLTAARNRAAGTIGPSSVETNSSSFTGRKATTVGAAAAATTIAIPANGAESVSACATAAEVSACATAAALR